MARFALRFEGVDFTETMFDTEKLSVVRGASRALEAIAPVVQDRLTNASLQAVATTSGASIAAFLVEGPPDKVQEVFAEISALFASRGKDPDLVESACKELSRQKDRASRNAIIAAAPFAQLRILSALREIPPGEDDETAVARLEAMIRVQQMQGVGVRPLASSAKMCPYDRKRAATADIYAPSDTGPEKTRVSAESAARWHYGRMERQLLYLDAAVDRETFTNDFEQLTDLPEDEAKKLPAALSGKIAVLYADGDKFGSELIPGLARACGGHGRGLAVLSAVLLQRMRTFLSGTVADIAGRNNPFALTPDNRIRLETLLFGGDDALFIVPAWMGLWLAQRFVTETGKWTITDTDAASVLNNSQAFSASQGGQLQPFSLPMKFSVGMVMANRKTPIRSLRNLAYEAMRSAKSAEEGSASGGLDVEFLESIEPPHDGLDEHRKALTRIDAAGAYPIGRERVVQRMDLARHMWCGETPFPASQAHRALARAAMAIRDLQPSAGNAGIADGHVADALSAYASAARQEHADLLQELNLTAEESNGQFLRLHRLLQFRDYVKAAEIAEFGVGRGK